MSPDMSSAEQAETVAATYASALTSRDFAAAWALLSNETRAAFNGSLEDFADERSTFLSSARNQVVVGPPTNDPDELAEWWQMAGSPPLDPKHAYLIRLDYPVLSDTQSGYQLLLVAPDVAGVWKIWVVR